MSFGFQISCAPWRSGVTGTRAGAGPAIVRAVWGFLRSWFIRVAFCRLAPVACVLLLAGGRAWAAPAESPEEPAPMCDPNGASVAAPEDVPEVDTGHLEALPCEAQLLFSSTRFDLTEERKFVSSSDTAPTPVPHAAPSLAACEGARALSTPFPTRAEPAPALFSARAGLAPCRGFPPGQFRPPVTRG
jgi:hypothetical protein